MLPFSITSVQLLFHPVLKPEIGEILEKKIKMKGFKTGRRRKRKKKVGEEREDSVKMLTSKSNMWLFNISTHTKSPFDNKLSGR